MFTFILTFFVAYFFMYRVKFPPSIILLSEESPLICLIAQFWQLYSFWEKVFISPSVLKGISLEYGFLALHFFPFQSFKNVTIVFWFDSV